MVKLKFVPMESLFNAEAPVPEGTMRDAVVSSLKDQFLVGIPESKYSIEFDSESGDDILVKRVDLENALGSKVFDSTESYFEDVQRQLYQPSEQEILGG